MKPAVVTKINPYTGNHVHTVELVRKEVNGTGFPWKVVTWECQGCLRTHPVPYWCCPKCGGYAVLMTEEQFNAKRRKQDSIRRVETSREDSDGDLVCNTRSPDESGPEPHVELHGRKPKHERH